MRFLPLIAPFEVASSSVDTSITNNGGLKIVGDLFSASLESSSLRTGSSFVYLHGLKSVRASVKSDALRDKVVGELPCCSVTRFDFRGHGDSCGDLKTADFTLTGLLSDCSSVLNEIDRMNNNPQRYILVGSSLGGFVACWMACLYPKRVAGLVLLAPGIGLKESWQQLINKRTGEIEIPSDWVSDGFIRISSNFLKDFDHRYFNTNSETKLSSAGVLASRLANTMKRIGRVIPIYCAHGDKDDVLDWWISERFIATLREEMSNDTHFIFDRVTNGDHRLADDVHDIYDKAINMFTINKLLKDQDKLQF